MTEIVNPILPTTALLRPKMPDIYERKWIYDPTWNSPDYDSYTGTKIVPAVGSLVRDSDNTPLWVVEIDPVTYYPTYEAVPINAGNDNIVSILDYGNSLLRLYTDNRALPYPVTPDSKCVVIGKSPRYYTLTRYEGTDRETVISQYYDATGQLSSQLIPLVALDTTKSSWYLPRCHVNVILEDNEEIIIKVFSENGSEVYTAKLFAKQSAVINEDALYAPTIVGMSISGNQKLANGKFFLYEKQAFGSLGLTASLIYDDGTTNVVPVDGTKCILYGAQDFISSYAGLEQSVTVKYFRSRQEAINPSIGDATGQMISVTVPVTVIPNAFAATNKILVIPTYSSSLARYVLRYWLYYADGRSHADVSPYVNIVTGSVNTTSAYFGVSQTFVIGVDMHNVDPVNYPATTIYQQTVVANFGPPLSLVKWTLKDAATSSYILGQDISSSRRPSIKYDSARQQYFIPTGIFANKAAFIKSFYTQAAPPYDPSVSLLPQQPTHFVVRDLLTGNQLVSAPITVDNYGSAFNVIGDISGNRVNSVLIVEFINKVNASVSNILFACPVDVTTGTYIS